MGSANVTLAKPKEETEVHQDLIPAAGKRQTHPLPSAKAGGAIFFQN